MDKIDFSEICKVYNESKEDLKIVNTGFFGNIIIGFSYLPVLFMLIYGYMIIGGKPIELPVIIFLIGFYIIGNLAQNLYFAGHFMLGYLFFAVLIGCGMFCTSVLVAH